MLKTFIIVVILLITATTSVFAQEEIVEEPQSTPSAHKKQEYYLPYPGMLPDNPLYKIKQLRDKIIVKLISSPIKKVEFHILQADKQSAMILPLIEKNRVDLAKQIALRAEDNITQITFVYKTTQTTPDENTFSKLEQSIQKHQEVYMKAIDKSQGDDKKVFTQVLNFSKTNWDELKRIYPQASPSASQN